MLSAHGRITHTPLADRGTQIKVLAVDDSKFFLGALRKALEAIPNVRVVGTAANGKEAIREIERLKPDLLTLDLEMPEMDGLETLKLIRQKRLPVRVIMVSAHTSAGAEKTLEALELGAEDFITKPSSAVSGDKIEYLRNQLAGVVESFRKPERSALQPRKVVPMAPARPKRPVSNQARDMVVIAVSTGGPRALSELVKGIPANFKGSILIAQHMPALFTKTLAERLNRLTHLTVTEAVAGERILPGRVYVAPGGFHMEVEGSAAMPVVKVHDGPRLHGCRPAADHLFRSAASLFGSRCQGIVMTGMGNDGTEGAKLVSEAGGLVYGQDEATCAVWGMPKQAAESGALECLLPLQKLAGYMAENASGLRTARFRGVSGV